MQACFCLDHADNVTGLMLERLRDQDFTVSYPYKIEVPIQLSTEHGVFIDLE